MNAAVEGLIRQAFGFGYTLPGPPSKAQLLDAAGLNRYQVEGGPDELYIGGKKTWLGTPWLYPVKFGGGRLRRFDSRDNIEETQVDDMFLPPATLVDIERSKLMEETPLRGSADSVTELWGFESWSIRIRGLCLNGQGQGDDRYSAREFRRMLLKYEEVIEPVKVSGAAFLDHGIDYINVRRVRFGAIEGKPRTIPYEIEATSARAPELTYF